MQTLERSSLNRKLTSMCLQAAASALLVVYVAFALATVTGQRRAERQELEALAAVLAQGGLDAVQFNDRRLASSCVAALEARRGIASAVLYDRKGQPFAAWHAPGRDAAGPVEALGGLDADIVAKAADAGSRPWLPVLRVYRVLGAPAGAEGRALPPVGAVMIESDLVPCPCGWTSRARWA
jgi:two-component system, sensor histidine kinase and response regulator